MNLSDVKIRVKRQFGDESAVQVTDADITRWTNDAQREITLNNEGLLEATSAIDLIAGQQQYNLPVNCFILKSITCQTADAPAYIHMQGMSIQQFDSFMDGWDGTLYGPGTPTVYTVFADIVRVFPIPAVTSLSGLKFYYTKSPGDVANDNDTINLPVLYHNAVVNYCLQKAYELDEDWNGSNAKGQELAKELHIMRNRDGWRNQETYQTITVLPDDSW